MRVQDKTAMRKTLILLPTFHSTPGVNECHNLQTLMFKVYNEFLKLEQ